jgi:tetratricopeptide (TPR) repeat protein
LSAGIALGLLLVLAAQAPEKAAPAATPPPAEPTLEELWAGFVRADNAGDDERRERTLREIRRVRMERNIPSLDAVGLGLVERGVLRLDAGERDRAEDAFRAAVDLAPGLPDAYAGLALALLKKGPLGVVPSIEAAVSGVSDFAPTGRGSLRAVDLATVAGLLSAFGVGWAVAVALLLRHGGLLLHDLEEWLGPAQSRSASRALFLLLLLLPVATFQGWSWLPLWALALLFAYLDWRERALALLLLLAALAVGPAVASLEGRLRTARNPLYHAALSAVETAPAPTAIARLEEASRKDPEDRDLDYLLGAALRRAGRYADASELYRQVLARDPSDAFARNNLANIEFAHGGYESAGARYRAGTEAGVPREVAATSYYNLSLVHLQKFEYQAYGEAKSNADRLAPGLVADYDRWRYDTRDYAVVDLGLTPGDVQDKFAGAETGVAVRNVASGGSRGADVAALAAALVNRFAASVAVFALVALLVARWRGSKAFTLHCARCGAPFCRSCHLGQVSGNLCTQCYHLFVVRDGVSGPARNRKMSEVQRAERGRERIFRVLSILSPGAGQVYGGWTLRGAAVLAAWYSVVCLVVAGHVVPFTDVPRRLSTPWAPVAVGLPLLLVWLVANRFRPTWEVELPARPARRARAGAA